MTSASPAPLPLTAGQTDIWFDEMLSDRGPAHNMADYLDIRGSVDPGHLVQAMTRLFEEAECSRSRFVLTDDAPVVLIEPVTTLPLRIVDLRGRAGAVDEAIRAMWDDLLQRFDISDSPLFRMILFKIDATRDLCYLAMHHLVCDGFSRVALYRRLAELFAASAGAGTVGEPLRPLRVLLDAEESYSRSAAVERDREFWRKELTPPPQPLSLAARPATPAIGFLRRSHTVSGAAARRLRASAVSSNVTWPALVIAATAAYMGRVAGRTDIVLTLPVTARVGAQTRSVPGMVANYLPLRITATPSMSVGELRQQVSRTLLRILKHQRYRADRIRQDLGVRSDERMSFGPYINVLPQSPAMVLGDATATLHNLSTGVVDDLMVTVLDGDDEAVEIHLNGNPGRYSDRELTDHLARFTGFLEAFAGAEPTTPLGRIDLVTRPEAEQLERWQGHVEAEPYIGVVERVRRFARERPESVAVSDDDRTLTYEELVGTASAISRRLEPGSVAAVLDAPGCGFVAGVLGALGAGAAWIPLDVDAPLARTAAMVADAQVDVLLVGPEYVALAEQVADLCEAPPRVLSLVAAADRPTELFAVRGRSRDVAYVIFTSGSTGRPKGAMVHRGGLVNHLLAKVEDLTLDAADHVVQNAPVTFDVSVWQMLAPLIVGGRVRVVTRRRAADPEALFAMVRAERITVLEVVPSLLRAGLDLWDAGLPVPEVDPPLRYLMVTGEAMPADLCERWFDYHRSVPIINAYGPTECSDDVTHALIRAGDRLDGRVPIGYPVRNTRLYVLGDDLRPMPVNTIGELYVGGAGVGHGYLGDAVKTALSFVPDPYAEPGAAPGTRMYRTGDRVVRREDGQLEFVERRDHQVKVRGHRIELGEIEAAIRALPQVSDVAVTAVTERGATRLAAYLVTAEVDLAGVRAALSAVLPDYMVPSTWVPLTALPLTAHGKVDRAALKPLPPAAGALSTASGNPPVRDAAPAESGGAGTTRVRELLCEAFAQVLQLDSVAVDDSFFALGGDSISAIQVVSRARRRGVVITARDVFAAKTPARIAAVAIATGVDIAPASSAVVQGSGEIGLLPIAAQLWEDHPAFTGSVEEYSQHVVVRTPVGADLERLTVALRALLDRHDMLRLRVDTPAPDLWTLCAAPAGATPLVTRVELGAGLDPAELRQLVDRNLEQARTRLDPRNGTVLRGVFLDGGTDTNGWLLLVVHHLAVDGVSWRILLTDLEQAWNAVAAGRTPRLEAVPTSYRAWSQALAVDATSADRLGELEFWRAQRDDSRIGRRPLDPRIDTYGTAGRLRLELDSESTAALLTVVPTRFHAEINDVLLAGLALAVAEWRRATGRAGEMVVELEGHGREYLRRELDLSRTVGWFTSVFPLRLDPGVVDHDEGSSLAGVVKRVKEQVHAVPDRGLGYGLLRYSNPRTAPLLAGSVPEIGFNYLGRIVTVEGMGDWAPGLGTAIGTGVRDDMPLRHVIAVTPVTEDRADGPHLVADWLWAPGAMDDVEAADLAAAWFRVLGALVEHGRAEAFGGHTPSDFPLVSVGQEEIERWEAESAERGDALSDVLSLTAIQRGMLFQAEFATDEPDFYQLQIEADLVGPLNRKALSAALRELVRRHPALRSTFRIRATESPVSLVYDFDSVAWRDVDLRGWRPEGQRAEVAGLARADRTSRFDLSEPGLMRLTLAALGDDRHHLIWTLHHILMDGWSMPILVRELMALYDGARGGSALPAAPPFSDYLRFLAEQDRDAARAAWDAALSGVAGPTFLTPVDARRGAGLPETVRRKLTAEVSTAVADFAANRDLTLGTLIQACWALLLAEQVGGSDVLFGCTVSTRPSGLVDAENIVGMFLNTLPVRVALTAAETVWSFLARLQEEQSALRSHDYLGITEMVRGNAALAGLGEPFDTAVVVENMPTVDTGEALSATLRIEGADVRDARHYPLSLVVQPGPRLELRFDFAAELLDRDRVEALSARFVELLAAVAATHASTPVSEIVDGTPWSRATPTTRENPSPAIDVATPAGRVVRDLCTVFASVLGLAEAGPHDNFFALGGDSIASIQVVAQARLLGIVITPQCVFTARTPAGLAAIATAVTDSAPVTAPATLVTLSADEMAELEFDLEI
ncbi:amino acid adenylation domain-containing protein [Actinoplanes sp. NPDC051346]|uniref:amino acid adenylation domain-containing protein n=1 Tax=Actinoplanes sp. NPDC051346 TaxID=3155048 RepID=UPI003418C0EE